MPTKFNLKTRTRVLKKYILVLVMLFYLDLNAQEPKDCCSTIYNQDTLKLVSLNELSKEFRRLKHKPCEDCNSWASSGLQQVMVELGMRLEDKSKSEIRTAMGKPDSNKENKWIYYWRNGHDYLYFEFINGQAKAQWYYAYE